MLVIDTRTFGNEVVRVRKCQKCNRKIKTVESEGARVDNGKERDRLLAGLCLALSESTVSRSRLRAIVGDKTMEKISRISGF